MRRLCAVAWLLLWALPAQAAAPSLLVLPLEMTDTSGEANPRAQEHAARLAALARQLGQDIQADGIYRVVDDGPIRAEIDKIRASQSLSDCNGCVLDLAQRLHAERVLVGEVYKVSTLIGSMRLDIIDVATGRTIFHRGLDFRGDTDDAWRHAGRFFVRDLAKLAVDMR
jgi:Protein of unknown function (DUF2380)